MSTENSLTIETITKVRIPGDSLEYCLMADAAKLYGKSWEAVYQRWKRGLIPGAKTYDSNKLIPLDSLEAVRKIKSRTKGQSNGAA